MDQGIAVKVFGRVQGVGFRAWVSDRAKKMGLKGWVKNEPDRTLTLEAYGNPKMLDALVREIHHGPSLSHVTRVVVTDIPFHPDSSFRIKY